MIISSEIRNNYDLLWTWQVVSLILANCQVKNLMIRIWKFSQKYSFEAMANLRPVNRIVFLAIYFISILNTIKDIYVIIPKYIVSIVRSIKNPLFEVFYPFSLEVLLFDLHLAKFWPSFGNLQSSGRVCDSLFLDNSINNDLIVFEIVACLLLTGLFCISISIVCHSLYSSTLFQCFKRWSVDENLHDLMDYYHYK